MFLLLLTIIIINFFFIHLYLFIPFINFFFYKISCNYITDTESEVSVNSSTIIIEDVE
jgi:hypothetical protein